MGLFDFVKDAGQKVEQQAKAQVLTQNVAKLGLKVENLKIEVGEAGVATVSGKVASDGEREKVVLFVGNTHGIARVDDRLEVAAPVKEPETSFYTVQKGDSLSKIAQVHYGDAKKYPIIFEANRPLLTDPNKIYPGQVLRIPRPGATGV